jgi:hypothetical protein
MAVTLQLRKLQVGLRLHWPRLLCWEMRGDLHITGDPALWRSQPLIAKRIGTFSHDVPLVGGCMTQLPSA